MPVDPLAHECRALTRYLTGTEVTPYVLEKYHLCHTSLPTASEPPPPWFDRALLRVARSGPLGAGLVDSYTRWFSPGSVVRYKLTLLLAVLENSPGFHDRVTSAIVGTRWGVISSLTLAGLREAVALLVSVVIFGPLNLLAVATMRKSR